MKETKSNGLFCIALLLCFYLFMQNISASDDICRLFSNGTEIGDPDSCNKYIQCIDFVSNYGTCSGKQPYYNKDTKKCVATLSDDSRCKVNCTDSIGHFVSDTKSCKGYYYCQDESSTSYGTCPEGTHFNSTQQKCVYQYESECHSGKFDYCSVVANGVNFKDESHCGKYYVCTKGILNNKACSGKYYDAATGVCVRKSLVNCPAHPLPTNVCGTTKKPIVNKFVSDGATCRGYFHCAEKADGPDTNPTWGQCPQNMFFNGTTNSCGNPLDIVCDEDRCDGRTLQFVSSGTKGCRNYLRCSNGITLDEGTCGNNFFDEIKGVCTSTIIKYNSCKL